MSGHQARGRAHLEALLGGFERVVRVTPDDVLVLTGFSEADIAERAPDDIATGLSALGVQHRGVIVAAPGADLDSIDMTALHAMDLIAADTPVGEDVPGVLRTGFEVELPCPRCGQELPLRVVLVVTDDLRTAAATEQAELSAHALSCPGAPGR